tara:strand:- start:899 stop:1282 length:384 start_codon:yes stop_codon:yes gene_type:complete
MAKDLKKLTLVQLAAEYNSVAKALGRDPIKKFRDRDTGIQRTAEIRKQFAAIRKSRNGVRGRPAAYAGKTIHPVSKTNPRQPGSFGWHSFEAILKSPGLTYEQYLASGGRNNDLRWDVAHEFVEVRS